MAFFQDLLHQREQLENVDRKLDKMKQDTRISQKHITSIKSVFGGLKNYFSGNKDLKPAAEPPPKPESQSASALRYVKKHSKFHLVKLDQVEEHRGMLS